MWKDKTRLWNAHLGRNEFISQGRGNPSRIGCCSDTRNMQTVPSIRIWEGEIKGLSVWQELFDGLLDDTFFYICLNLMASVATLSPKKKPASPHRWIILPFREGFPANKSGESKYVNGINILLQRHMHECVGKSLGTITHCNM